MYNTAEEVSMRLLNTYISDDEGHPVYVCEVIDEEYVRVKPLNPLGGFDEHGDIVLLQGLDLRPARLGFINWQGSALYLQRAPLRKYKQGLSSQSLLVDDSPTRGRKDSVMECGLPFINMWRGIYPSFEEALDMVLRMGVLSCSFHRDWAIQRGIMPYENSSLFLRYKNHERVGGVSSDQRLELNNQRSYLKEALWEATNGN